MANSTDTMGKMSALKARYDSALAEVSDAEEAKRKLESSLIQLKESAEQANDCLLKAQEKLDAAEREYKEFTDRKDAYEKEKAEAEQQLAVLRNS